jgi:hypothetical protein
MTIPLTHPKPAELVELSEAEAYTDFLAAAPAKMGFATFRIQSATVLVAPKIDIPLLNRVIGLGILEPAKQQSIEESLSLFHQHGVRNFAFQISPAAQPGTLSTWLEARQFIKGGRWAKVYRPAQPPVVIPTDLRIKQIGTEYASEFARVACMAFEMPDFLGPCLEAIVGRPGWHCFLAWDGAQPVACAALFVTSTCVGWLGIGGTLPAHRRRGAQGALMAQRIRLGAELGCEWLITETGEDTPLYPNPSFHNMIRTGFQMAYLRQNYYQENKPA